MVTAADGSAFTGAVTVYVTGDAGTQGAGSVGAGACTHEGNGYHTYAPAQAETNYDLIAFTFVGSGAIPATVQVFTNTATLATAIKAKTDNLPAAPAATGDCITAAGVRSAVGLASANLDTQLDALPTGAENATAVWGAGARTLTALDEDNTTLDLDATIRAAVGLGSANLDTQLGDLPTNAELATALATADDAVLAAIAALNNLSQANIRTAIGLGSANLDTQLDALPTNAELATALGTADDAVLAAIAALNNLSQANIRTAVGLASANLDTQLDALPTNAELATALAAADDAVLAAIAALNNLSQANIRTAVGLGSANLDTQLADLPTNSELATALSTLNTLVDELHKFRGLSSGNPWTTTETSENAGGVTVNFTGDGETTATATRV